MFLCAYFLTYFVAPLFQQTTQLVILNFIPTVSLLIPPLAKHLIWIILASGLRSPKPLATSLIQAMVSSYLGLYKSLPVCLPAPQIFPLKYIFHTFTREIWPKCRINHEPHFLKLEWYPPPYRTKPKNHASDDSACSILPMCLCPYHPWTWQILLLTTIYPPSHLVPFTFHYNSMCASLSQKPF